MKLSIAIASEKAPSSAFVVWRGFETSFKKAVEFGYRGVELALRSAEEFQTENIEYLLQKNHLSVSCISTGQFFAAEGLCFTHPDLEIRRKTLQAFRKLLPIAADWGGMINIGRVRGSVPQNASKASFQKIFIDSLCELLPEAERYGVTLIIEPVNRYEINYINTVDEAAELVRTIGSSSLGIMPDIFHMNIEDDDICKALIRNKENIRYVHLADTNRYYPGCGHMDFESILQSLVTIGYSGWCSIEILPLPNPDEAARGAARYLLRSPVEKIRSVWDE